MYPINMLLKVISSIKMFRTNISVNIKRLFVYSFVFFVVILLILNSGYLGQQLFDSRTKQLILIATVAIIAFLYILFLDYKIIFSTIKSRKIRLLFSPELIVLLSLFLFLVLSFVFNTNKSDNLNGYLMMFSLIVCSFFLIRLFTLRQFARMFVGVNLAIALISIVIFLFTTIAGRDLSMEIFQKSNLNFVSSFFGVFFKNQTNYNTRLQGPFWEPGVFATFSLISILLYHYFFDKKRFFVPLFFSFVIVLTKSTAGYLILIPIWFLIFVNNLSRKDKTFMFVLSFIFAVFLYLYFPMIIGYLSSVMPNVFGKIADMDVSFVTRLTSLSYGFEIFKTSPFFGVGGVTARNLYFNLANADELSIDAFTSTFGFFLAAYGSVGALLYLMPVAGIFMSKKLGFDSKAILIVIYFLLTQKESHVEVMAIQILYYFIFFGALSSHKKFASNPSLFKFSNTSNNLVNLLFSKNEKGNVASNLTINTFVKIISLLVSFITIPVYYKYFGDNQLFYGLWLTLISTSTWILTFDFGFGNSLRNKLAEAIVNKQKETSQRLISTTYLLTAILSLIWIIFSIVVIFSVDLNAFFKIDQTLVPPNVLRFSVFIILTTIALELVLKNIIYVLQVIGKSGLASSLGLISNLSMLLILSFLSIKVEYKYQFISIIYMLCILTPLLIASVHVFGIKKSLPFFNLKMVDKKSFDAIAKLGVGFFVVQLSNLFLWALNSIIITNLLGDPGLVVDYTIFYKLYSSITGLSMIIQGPIWVSVSMAYARGDKKSVINSLKFVFLFESMLFIATVLITMGLPFILNLWLGASAPSIKTADIIIMLLFSLISTGYGAIVLICNGLAEVKSQLYIAGLAVLLKIPLVLLLNHLFRGSITWSVVILANVLLLIPYIIICPLRVKKILRKMELSQQ